MPELEAAVCANYPPRSGPRRARSDHVPQAIAELSLCVIGNRSVPAVNPEQLLHSFCSFTGDPARPCRRCGAYSCCCCSLADLRHPAMLRRRLSRVASAQHKRNNHCRRCTGPQPAKPCRHEGKWRSPHVTPSVTLFMTARHSELECMCEASKIGYRAHLGDRISVLQ